MGNVSCQSDANKTQQSTEQPAGAVLASPLPGTAAMPGYAIQPLNSPAPMGGNAFPPLGQPIEITQPIGASPIISGAPIDYPVDHQMPADYFTPTVCHGQNCPKATHVEISPGVYKSLDNPEDIIYANAGPAGIEDAVRRISDSGGHIHRLSDGHQVQPIRLSGGSHQPQPIRLSGERRRSNGSQQNNNLIVAAAVPVDEPKEEAAPAEEPKEEAPKKKKRRRRFGRKRAGRGGDEGAY